MNFLDDSVSMEIWEKSTPEPNTGCWLWTSTHHSAGYAVFRINGVAEYVHRGVLCMLCNNALGAMQDDTDRMLRAIAYLRKAP